MSLLSPGGRVFVTQEPIDLRRGHDGLSALVRAQWGDALFDGHLFVFLGRRFDRCKILFWERGGLVLYYKRLERGRFRPPGVSADVAATLRKGFDATVADPELLATAKNANIEMSPMNAEAVSKAFADFATTPKHLIERAKAAITTP